MAVDEGVDAPVQADARLPGGRVVRRRRAAHEIAQQVADQRAAGTFGQQDVGQDVQEDLLRWRRKRLSRLCQPA
jgi:hypothetical protein